MALKYRVKAREEIPAELQRLYVERNGELGEGRSYNSDIQRNWQLGIKSSLSIGCHLDCAA